MTTSSGLVAQVTVQGNTAVRSKMFINIVRILGVDPQIALTWSPVNVREKLIKAAIENDVPDVEEFMEIVSERAWTLPYEVLKGRYSETMKFRAQEIIDGW